MGLCGARIGLVLLIEYYYFYQLISQHFNEAHCLQERKIGVFLGADFEDAKDPEPD